MKGYLSGPMLGYADLNYPTFERWTTVLRERGHEVMSPHEVEEPDLEGEERIWYYMREDLRMVADADCLWMIPGWVYSKGAKIEAMTAQSLGIPLLCVISEETLDIPRIHLVVECAHARTQQHLSEPCLQCRDCFRYPIYDSTFRMDVV